MEQPLPREEPAIYKAPGAKAPSALSIPYISNSHRNTQLLVPDIASVVRSPAIRNGSALELEIQVLP